MSRKHTKIYIQHNGQVLESETIWTTGVSIFTPGTWNDWKRVDFNTKTLQEPKIDLIRVLGWRKNDTTITSKVILCLKQTYHLYIYLSFDLIFEISIIYCNSLDIAECKVWLIFLKILLYKFAKLVIVPNEEKSRNVQL